MLNWSSHPQETYSNKNIQDFAQSNSQIRHLTNKQRIAAPPRPPQTQENYFQKSNSRQGRKRNVSRTPFHDVLKTNRFGRNQIHASQKESQNRKLSRGEHRKRVHRAYMAASGTTNGSGEKLVEFNHPPPRRRR